MAFLTTIKKRLLDLLYPDDCVACGKADALFCEACLSDLPPAERYSDNWIYPLFDYRHPAVKKSLWLFKYKNKRGFGELFGIVMHERIVETISELAMMENFQKAIIVPIPLSKRRFRSRGYNQAELVANEILREDAERNFVLGKDILLKPKETPRQAHLKNKNDRIKNVAGSFWVNEKSKEMIKNKNIILVDDILTTGATLGEARRVLRDAGAKKVLAFTIAH